MNARQGTRSLHVIAITQQGFEGTVLGYVLKREIVKQIDGGGWRKMLQ